MVEGHSVHRVATLHRQRLVGKQFTAWSPNGRFKDGANEINGKTFSRIEAHGKNLFCFFGEDINQNKITDIARKSITTKDDDQDDENVVVVHVHFGMAGAWAVYLNNDEAPEPTPTNRLRLEYDGIIADLSAMTVQHGGIELYRSKLAKLGEDPLRNDANPDALWARIKKSKKGIGALIMDQSFFTGPGNIYRAEILFKAGVHPDRPGLSLEKEEFDRIWQETVLLLNRGYETGSILTVDPDEAKTLGKPRLRRYIYNTSKCPRCGTSIQSWPINNRTCYACPKCQPLTPKTSSEPTKERTSTNTDTKDHVPFNSHCARESVAFRLKETGPSRLTIKEIKQELTNLGVAIPSGAKRKAQLAELLLQHLSESKQEPSKVASSQESFFISSEDAALEKAQAGENLAVEHIAELAPGQARRARSRGSHNTSTTPRSRVSIMKVKDIKNELTRLNIQIPSKAKKAQLMDLLYKSWKQEEKETPVAVLPEIAQGGKAESTAISLNQTCNIVSPEDAAMEKARTGENLAVEHIAVPSQARKARARILFPTSDADGSSDYVTKTGRKRRRTKSGLSRARRREARKNAANAPSAAITAEPFSESDDVPPAAVAVEDTGNEENFDQRVQEAVDQRVQEAVDRVMGNNAQGEGAAAIEIVDEVTENQQGRNRRRLIIPFFFFIVVTGGGSAAFTLLRQENIKPVSATESSSKPSPGSELPNKEDCETIREETPVNTDLINLDILLDVVLSKEEDFADSNSTLAIAMQDKLVPQVADCTQPNRRGLEQLKLTRFLRRKLETDTPQNPIVNASVTAEYQIDGSCSAGMSQPCRRANVNAKLVVREEVDKSNVVPIVEETISVDRLGLAGYGFEEIKIVRATDPTASPIGV